MPEDKIYIGKGKKKEFANGGSVLKLTLTLDGLGEIYKQHGFSTDTGVKKLKIEVAQMKSPDKYDNTHTVYVDTFKPDPGFRGDN